MNPALTAMANSLRVGDHLLERLGARRERPGRGALIPPSGLQFELSDGDQRAVVVEVGGGLRTYASVDEISSMATARTSCAAPAAGRCCSRGRTDSRTGATSSTASATSCRSTSRTEERDPRPRPLGGLDRAEFEPDRVVMDMLHPRRGYPFRLEVAIEYACPTPA